MQDGPAVRLSFALMAPVVPLLVLSSCLILQIFSTGSGITAILKAEFFRNSFFERSGRMAWNQGILGKTVPQSRKLSKRLFQIICQGRRETRNLRLAKNFLFVYFEPICRPVQFVGKEKEHGQLCDTAKQPIPSFLWEDSKATLHRLVYLNHICVCFRAWLLAVCVLVKVSQGSQNLGGLAVCATTVHCVTSLCQLLQRQPQAGVSCLTACPGASPKTRWRNLSLVSIVSVNIEHWQTEYVCCIRIIWNMAKFVHFSVPKEFWKLSFIMLTVQALIWQCHHFSVSGKILEANGSKYSCRQILVHANPYRN